MADTPITRRQAGQIMGAAAATPLLTAQSSDICFLSAVEMAGLIRRKKLSAREVMAAHLKQIDRVNPKVNAIVTLVAAQALENAGKADELQAKGAPLGPLHGLPIAHKDLVETAGIRTTFGSLIFKDYVPKEDAIIVERIRRAGAIAVGKTNTPEFGAGSQTFNRVFGATKNPYDLTKTCGGSSGGNRGRAGGGAGPEEPAAVLARAGGVAEKADRVSRLCGLDRCANIVGKTRNHGNHPGKTCHADETG